MPGEKFSEGFGGVIDDAACGGKRAVVEGKRRADGVVQLAVREPGNIVEVGGNAGGFFDVKGYDQAVSAGLEVVAHLGEEPALNEFVGGGLQFVLAGGGVDVQSTEVGDLRLREGLEAFGVNFAQRRGGNGGVLRIDAQAR